MLDLKFVRDNADLVRENCRLRRSPADIDSILELAERRHVATLTLQEIQRQQNETARQMKSAAPEERGQLIQRGKDLKAQAEKVQHDLDAAEQDVRAQLALVPNLTHPDSPRDQDKVIREVGDKPRFDFRPLDHVALCDKHGLADFESAARVTGSNFYYLTGDGALLELALVQYGVRLLVEEGFRPVLTPDLAREKILDGTGYIPRGPETQIYRIADSDLGLIATAEITLAGMFAEQTIDADRLPILLVGVSHCFRTEAGAAGRATRGLFRVHQFTKVEMFAFTRPEDSEAMHQRLLAIEERIFRGLEIPYRVLDIAGADLGGPAYRKYDVEAWMPGRGEQGEYGEVTSTSNCTDYQARRLQIRFKTPGQKGTQFVHMLNGTAVACGRAIIALLENHQQPDGRIRIPPALVPYFGKNSIG